MERINDKWDERAVAWIATAARLALLDQGASEQEMDEAMTNQSLPLQLSMTLGVDQWARMVLILVRSPNVNLA